MALKKVGIELTAAGAAQFNSALKSAQQNVDAFGKTASATSAKVNTAGASIAKAANQIDSFGRQARIGLSSAGQAAQLLGANLSGVVGPASAAADAIGDIVGAGAALGPIGLAFAGLSLVVGKVVEEFSKAEARMAAVKKPFQEARAELEKIGQVDPFAKMAGSIGLATDKLREMATASVEIREQVLKLLAAEELKATLAQAERELRGQLAGLETTLGGIAAHGSLYQALNQALDQTIKKQLQAEAAVRSLTAALLNQADAANTDAAALQRQIEMTTGRINAAASMSDAIRTQDGWMGRLGTSIKLTSGQMDYLSGKTDAAGNSLIKMAEQGLAKANAAAQKLRDTFKSLIEGALSPTTVSAEDQAAAAMGTYVDKWDEFRRRVEAVKTGTAPESFGDVFAQQLADLNMPLDQVISKFKNFSLFVGGQNFDLVNFDAITAQIEEQLLGMAGKAALTAESMKRVWANLSPTARAALSTQGIDNAEEALAQLVDPAGAAEEKVAGLNAEIGKVPALKTTVFNVVKAETFDPNLQRILDDINQIPEILDAEVTIVYRKIELPPNENPPPPPNELPPGYQRGGYGIVGRDNQLFRAHAGEGFWFSGVDWKVGFPELFQRRVAHMSASAARYGDFNAPVNIVVNAPIAGGSRVDVDRLANAISSRLRDQMLSFKRNRA